MLYEVITRWGQVVQIGGRNFLLPTDVSVDSERALRYSSIDIQERNNFV